MEWSNMKARWMLRIEEVKEIKVIVEDELSSVLRENKNNLSVVVP